MQKLEDVLDGLNRLQDELCTQSCDLLDVRNRCVLIEKQMDHIVHAHVHVSCMTVQHVHIMYYFTTLNCTCIVLYIRNIQHPLLHVHVRHPLTSQQPSQQHVSLLTYCIMLHENHLIPPPNTHKLQPTQPGPSNSSQQTTPARHSPTHTCAPQQNPLFQDTEDHSDCVSSSYCI